MGSRLDPVLRRLGPALRNAKPPWTAIAVSAAGHLVLVAVIIATAIWSGWGRTKVHIVNLVPAIAAVGNPNAPATPSLPRRAPTPLASRAPEPAPQPREAAQREAPRLPEPSLSSPRLPSRPAAIKPGEKELPPMGSSGTQRAEKAAESRPPAPTASLGQPTGSPSGVGALTLNVSDFPYAWYLRQVLGKVQGQWERQGQLKEPVQKPQVFVEIQRDGSIQPPRIEKSSGNLVYDQAALRAVTEASPFPPLPEGWDRPSLRILFTFELGKERG
ncbi:MAG TPA: TonB family protein [Methylomirabilota bacterium]|nr:TonB family protein [Methylomirabilota bacterium]